MKIIICELCHEPISVNDPSTRYCSTCEAIREYERNHTDDSPTVQDKLKSPLGAMLEDIENYNKANNTCLTYGKYVDRKKRGLI